MCLSDTLAKQSLDEALASKLKARLADMAAAETASDLFVGAPKELVGDRWDHMALSLSDQYQLVFKSGHSQPRLLDDRKVDWSRVRRVFIIGIEKCDE